VGNAGMKIPILNILIMKESTFERIIKEAAIKAHSFSKEQVGILLKDNDRLSQGLKPLRKPIKLRRRNNG